MMSISYINSLRLLNRSANLWYPAGSVIINTSLTGSQTVRWIKPRWIPKAPSKLYLVTQRRRRPIDEQQETLRIYNNYRSLKRLVQTHLSKENKIHEESGKLGSASFEKEEEEHKQLMEYNQQENERVARLRKERLKTEKEELIKSILAHKAAEEQKELEDIEESFQILKDTEELVKLFIEPKDFEKVILSAIDNPVDYNYAIDVDGRKYEGRWTQPHKVDIDSLPVLPVKDEGLTNQF